MAITSRLIAKFNSYYADKPGMNAIILGKLVLTPLHSLNDHDNERCMSYTCPTYPILITDLFGCVLSSRCMIGTWWYS